MTEITIRYFSAGECLLVACGDRQEYLPIADEASWQHLVSAVKRWTARLSLPTVEASLSPEEVTTLVERYRIETEINLNELDL